MKNGLIAYFVGNPVAAKLLMLFLILGGVLAGLNIHVRQVPDLDFRTIVVTLVSPGSSPREIEEDINRRIEESVVGLEGVDRVVSVASEGLARIELELETFADADAVLADVKNTIDSIEGFPPLSAKPPKIGLKRLTIEVLTISVASSTLSEDGLRMAAESLRDDLLALPSVSLVRLRGTRDREISIEMNEEELRRNGLSIAQVAREVRRSSLNLTFGELRTDAGGVVLHVVGKRTRGEEFKNIPLITRLDGSVVKLGDVARIRDGFVDEDILSEVDGKPAVFVRVEAGEEHSVFGISNAIRDWLATYTPPAGVEVEVWSDTVEGILDRFGGILQNAVIGTILVFVCLVLVFDLRVAFWIALGIPISFIGSLMFFGVSDLTLNMGTLFAFFLLIGIVVDDAVVVGESIATERERGNPSWHFSASHALHRVDST
ncbi:MAG: efflux RND transporter permease subunit, partial [Defluviicoccus sp.]|nr:efflux RND transporter permease subunit [Defluviicoccus sp.]